eukprot:576939-Amphidinium_carterae.1
MPGQPATSYRNSKRPGPSICRVNPGGWSHVTGALDLGHDIVQATFLLRDALATGHFTAKQHGYYSAFTRPGKPVVAEEDPVEV